VVPAAEGLLSDEPFGDGSTDLYVRSYTDPLYGTVDVSVDGGFTYLPLKISECGQVDNFQFTAFQNSTGDTAILTAYITVYPASDETKPRVVCKEKKIVTTVGKFIPFVFKSFLDECGEVVAIDQSPRKAPSEPGNVLVTATARDGYGNTGQCSTLVKVEQRTNSKPTVRPPSNPKNEPVVCRKPGDSCSRTRCCRRLVCKEKGTNMKGIVVNRCPRRYGDCYRLIRRKCRCDRSRVQMIKCVRKVNKNKCGLGKNGRKRLRSLLVRYCGRIGYDI